MTMPEQQEPDHVEAVRRNNFLREQQHLERKIAKNLRKADRQWLQDALPLLTRWR